MDDKSERCECDLCNPKPVPVGVDLIDRIRERWLDADKNLDAAGEYGSNVTKFLMANPMPPAVERALLQHAVDSWNGVNQLIRSLIQVASETLPAECPPPPDIDPDKTIEEALAILERHRARRANRAPHHSKDVIARALGNALRNIGLSVLDVAVVGLPDDKDPAA